MNDPGWSTRINCVSRSARPPCGSRIRPKSLPSEAAIAFTVKSRRARSSSIVPAATSGSAAGAAYVSRRQVTTSELPAVREADDRGPEAAVGGHLAAQAARELDRVALHGEVDVEALAAEQEIADGAADEVDALAPRQIERAELLGDGELPRGQALSLGESASFVFVQGPVPETAYPSAIASISTSAPAGSADTSTVARAGGTSPDVPAVDVVHRREVVEAPQIDGRLHDPVEAAARGLEDRAQVREHLLGLLPDVRRRPARSRPGSARPGPRRTRARPP